MRAKRWAVPDGLWERIEPLLPVRQRRFRYPSRKPLDENSSSPDGYVRADLRNSGRLELRTNSRASALDVEAGVLIVAHQSARDRDRLWLS